MRVGGNGEILVGETLEAHGRKVNGGLALGDPLRHQVADGRSQAKAVAAETGGEPEPLRRPGGPQHGQQIRGAVDHPRPDILKFDFPQSREVFHKSAPADRDNVLPCRVTDRTFLGDSVEYIVQVGDQPLMVKSSGALLFDVGEEAFAELDVNSCQVINS